MSQPVAVSVTAPAVVDDGRAAASARLDGLLTYDDPRVSAAQPLLVQPVADSTGHGHGDGDGVTGSSASASASASDSSAQFTVAHGDTKTGLLKTFANVMNDVLGVSVLGVPSFFKLSGIGLGPVLMCVFAVGTAFSLSLQRDMILRPDLHVSSFTEMAQRAFGFGGYAYANAIIFLFNFPSTLQVLGSTLPDLLTDWFGSHVLFARTPLILITVFATAPVTYYRTIDRFAYLSAVTTTSLMVVSVVIVGRFFASGDASRTSVSAHTSAWDRDFAHSSWLQALGGISYTFTCNDLFVHAIHSLEQPTPKRVTTLIGAAMGSFLALGTAVGVCGYLTFGSDVNDNYLASYGADDQLNNALRLLVIVGIVCYAPFTLFMPRVAVLAVLQSVRPHWVTRAPDGSNQRVRQVVHIALTTLLLGINLLVALLVTNLGAYFGFIGALSGISISLVLPPLSYLRLVPSASRAKKAACVFVACAGVMGAVSCTISLVVSLA